MQGMNLNQIMPSKTAPSSVLQSLLGIQSLRPEQSQSEATSLLPQLPMVAKWDPQHQLFHSEDQILLLLSAC